MSDDCGDNERIDESGSLPKQITVISNIAVTITLKIGDVSVDVSATAPCTFEDRFNTIESLLDVAQSRSVEQLKATLKAAE